MARKVLPLWVCPACKERQGPSEPAYLDQFSGEYVCRRCLRPWLGPPIRPDAPAKKRHGLPEEPGKG